MSILYSKISRHFCTAILYPRIVDCHVTCGRGTVPYVLECRLSHCLDTYPCLGGTSYLPFPRKLGWDTLTE